MTGIVKEAMRLKPEGIGWENWRRSTNVEDSRVEDTNVLNTIASDKESVQKFLKLHGSEATFNMLNYAIQDGIKLNKEVEDWANGTLLKLYDRKNEQWTEPQ